VKFWDATAVIPLCLKQPNTGAVKKLVEADGDIVAWTGALVEGLSAFARLRREAILDRQGEVQVRHVLERLSESWSEISSTNRVREFAARALLLHPLRAADSLQLAAALVWANGSPRALEFVCLEQRVREAASLEGFEVLPK